MTSTFFSVVEGSAGVPGLQGHLLMTVGAEALVQL